MRRGAQFLGCAGLAALGCSLAAPPAAAADFVMKIGTATINETQHQYMKPYKEALEKASGGRIEVQIYPASQLGPIPREIEGVQLGSIQGYVGPVDFYVGFEPSYGVLSAPMLVRDDAHVAATIHDAELQKIILGTTGPKRMTGIATFALGTAAYAAEYAMMRIDGLQGQEAAHQRHGAGARQDEPTRRDRRHYTPRSGSTCSPRTRFSTSASPRSIAACCRSC